MKRLFALLLASLLLTACAAPVEQTFTTLPPVTSTPAAQATRAAIQEIAFDPAQVGVLQSATLTWTMMDDRSVIHTAALTDGESLRILEGILSGARRMENIPMCFDAPVEHELTLVRADGAVITVLVSLDDCPVLREGDTCFDYKAVAIELTGKRTNAAIYDLFGAKLR